MRPSPLARALAALFVVTVAACGGDDSNGSGPNTQDTILEGFLTGTNGLAGNLEITVDGEVAPGVVALGSPLRSYDRMAFAVLNLSGLVQLSTGATIAVAGTWDTQTGAVGFTGGGYTFTGAYVNGQLTGTFLGPQVTGVFVMTIATTSGAISTYCGTVTGADAGGDPENGVLNLAIEGTDVFAMLVIDTQSLSATGTVTGNSVDLIVPGVGSASGSISGSTIGGTYNTAAGSSGTFQVSAAGCTGAPGGTVADVELNPDSYSLLPSDSVLVFATARDGSGHYVANATFTWDDNPAGVVSVHPVQGRSDAAWIVGLNPGSSVVGATAGGFTGSGTFTVVGGALQWYDVSAGYNFTCGRAYNPTTTANEAYCWGRNDVGNLGDGTTSPRTLPTLVAAPATGPITDWSTVEAGGGHACGLTFAGKLYCWGSDSDGRLGSGGLGEVHVPRPVTNPTGVTSWDEVAVGNSHSCARTGSDLYCWGYGSYGKLGDNSTSSRSVPTRVADPAGGAVAWNMVAVGESHTCAVASTGDAYCWGYNSGNLGNNDVVNSSVPVKVQAPPGVLFNTISAGGASCAVTTTNVGYCWGANGEGMLGDPAIATNGSSLVPVLVSGGHSYLQIMQGRSSTCGLAVPGPDGTPYCWGANFTGQLGNNSTNPANAPTLVAGSLTFFKTDFILSHACGVNSLGEAWCWGQNLYGEIGNGTSSTTTLELVPVKVGP